MNTKLGVLFALLSGGVLMNVQANAADLSPKVANLNPVVMDTGNAGETVLGLEYQFKGDLLSKALSDNEGSDLLAADGSIRNVVLSYDMRGTLATDKEKNPKDFQTFGLDAQLLHSTDKGTLKSGAFVKYEMDQGFDSKQWRYGLGATYGKSSLLVSHDFLGVDVNYGTIAVDSDVEREALLGEATLADYDRVDAEVLYLYPLKNPLIDTVEFNYRIFYELDAPDIIKANRLDQYELTTLHLGLKNKLYLAYSEGKLPFDRQAGQLFQLGISHNF